MHSLKKENTMEQSVILFFDSVLTYFYLSHFPSYLYIYFSHILSMPLNNNIRWRDAKEGPSSSTNNTSMKK